MTTSNTSTDSASNDTFRVFNHRLDRLFVPEDSTTLHVRNAECIYLRMLHSKKDNQYSPRSVQKQIESIDYIYNKKLAEAFEQKKLELIRDCGIEAGVEMLLFHGTWQRNVDSIIRNNFDLSKGNVFAHGKGLYFSELPSTSMIYGDALILCRVLTGRVQRPEDGSYFDPNRFDSFQTKPVKVSGHSGNLDVASVHVVACSEQVLPYCVYHFSEREAWENDNFLRSLRNPISSALPWMQKCGSTVASASRSMLLPGPSGLAPVPGPLATQSVSGSSGRQASVPGSSTGAVPKAVSAASTSASASTSTSSTSASPFSSTCRATKPNEDNDAVSSSGSSLSLSSDSEEDEKMDVQEQSNTGGDEGSNSSEQ